MDPSLNTFVIIFAAVTIVGAIIYTWWSWKKGSFQTRNKPSLELERHDANPIISPQPHREWESQGTFNPTAILDDKGHTHLFYRAIGGDGISRICHAFSKDGKTIDELSPYPVYVPLPGYGMPEPTSVSDEQRRHSALNPSGGGWGGAEDPRATKVGNKVYMTYTAFEGWHDMRIALTSISLENIKKRRWNWRRTAIISPPKARAKNWVIFPEKIRGKYAILHSVAPKVLVAYVDSLDAVPPIQSSADHGGYGMSDPSRETHWDKTMKGAGAPPIKTDKGWLVLYHAIYNGGYNVGAMLLDLEDPTKILYRSPKPILSPNAHYENDWKPGVVYACGATVKSGTLSVYYGGGDKHTCIAQVELAPLLNWLVDHGEV
jgi:beta-1,2-mannobiose phosphorylase / 1,2-beta-oligomannan phosphorylase